MMFYSLFIYAGLTLVILSGARVLDPFFEGLRRKKGEMIQLAVEVACFVIGAELLLKPAFEDQKIGTKKNITPRGAEMRSVRRQIRRKHEEDEEK